MGVRISSESFTGWISEVNLSEFVHGILTKQVRIQNFSEPCSDVQLAPLQQTEGLAQTLAGKHHDGQVCHRWHP